MKITQPITPTGRSLSAPIRALTSIVFAAYSMGATVSAQSLDDKYTEIKKYGSLYGFCKENMNIEECRNGIGAWNQKELERVKTLVTTCIDRCPQDTFGFVQTSDGEREYPEIETKDFDGWSPSRGVEFKMYPIAISILKYEGCAGCALTKSSPVNAALQLRHNSVHLPMLGYGTFYMPRAARVLAMKAAEESAPLTVNLEFGKSKETRMISSEAIKEYLKMLQLLGYSQLK